MSDERITIGEVYRICQRIESQVLAQNGRVRKLEDQAIEDRTNQKAEARNIKLFWSVGVVVAGFFGDWLKHKLGF